MANSKNLPTHVVGVATYRELEQYARAFADGHLNLLMLCGAPGIGKSQCFRRALTSNVCWIDGNASAFGIYLQAHEHRNQPLVLDDVDGLYRDRHGIRLLKALCQTDKVRTQGELAKNLPGQRWICKDFGCVHLTQEFTERKMAPSRFRRFGVKFG